MSVKSQLTYDMSVIGMDRMGHFATKFISLQTHK